ncbi:component of oligomeric golgi complex 6 [Dunaliella salina]|uniref:Conserved oligomeric Golgi complex subunit 6 n=1 Tax=Dunaliella salina TaxID=3046 RepID=A0ABQ7GXJ9_DUNSA|nr:component of oligomeric golgi complex 6 [Dunaliella salina]|eukprot:KAF5839327.1 component of oligomeric golgi complex 6 [Dunaliella salina]
MQYKQALDGVQSNLDGLADSCAKIQNVLDATKLSAAPLLGETQALQAELGATQHKAQLVEEFLEHYQLSQEEVRGSEGLNTASLLDRIFESICRPLRVRVEQVLMTSPPLLLWVQSECRGIGDFDAPEVDGNLQAAVRALQQRPVLFKYCAEEVATARHNALFQRFITALTRGGPSGMPRPIEIHAHDPKRYINDMLAWVHQSLASEREFVVALFGGDEPEALRSCRDMAHRSFLEHLRVRGEKLVQQPPTAPADLSVPPQISEAVQIMLDLIHVHESGLGVGTEGAPQELGTSSGFDAVLAAMLDPILEAIEASAQAMVAPPAKSSSGGNLGALGIASIRTQNGAPAPNPPTPAHSPSSQHMFAANCLAAVAGALAARPCARAQAERVAGVLGHRQQQSGYASLDPWTCYPQLSGALEARLSLLVAGVLETRLSMLVAGEVGTLLGRCGLAEVLERLAMYGQQHAALREQAQAQQAAAQAGAPQPAYVYGAGLAATPASDPSLSLQRIADTMRAFFATISSPDALPEFLPLQAHRVRADAVGRVAKSLVEAYEAVYAALDDPTNGYLEQGGTSAVKHSPAHVRTICGVV